MDKYEIQGRLGDGTYGIVLRAALRKTGERVAIKRMKQRFRTFDECTKLPEVVALRRLHSCPHVVRLRELFREPSGELSMVFDLMDCDLLAVIRKYKQVGIPHSRIRSMAYQIFQGLAAIHKLGYFHRDMKPENVLIRREPTGFETAKLADLGLVKEVRARPPYTDYVSTRWYRAPEILLQDKAYNSPVDQWAMGCILVELFTSRPLFPGSNEQDQLFKIVSVLGPPTAQTWPEGIELARKLGRRFPQCVATPLAQLYPSIPGPALDLIAKLLAINPRDRLSAAGALAHPFFQGLDIPPPAASPPTGRAASNNGAPPVAPTSSARPVPVPAGANPNTAPSPYVKGPAVDWADVSKGSAAAGAPQATGRSSLSGTNGSTVDVHRTTSSGTSGAPTAYRSAVPAGHQQPPAGSASRVHAPLLATAGRGGAAAAAPGATADGGKPHVGAWTSPVQPSPQGVPPLATSSATNAGAALPPAAATKKPSLRDSFDGLFKSAGVDVDSLLAHLDDPSVGRAVAPVAKDRSPPSPINVGGSMPRGPVSPPARTTPSGGAEGVTPPGGASASKILFGRRRTNPSSGATGDTTSPGSAGRPPISSPTPPAMAPSALVSAKDLEDAGLDTHALTSSTANASSGFQGGTSPLSKLLGNSRYRAGSLGNTNGNNNGGASADPDGKPITFKSPSFARRPPPLSVAVLQQQQQQKKGGAAAAATVLQSMQQQQQQQPAPSRDATNADVTAYRRLFAEEGPPGHEGRGTVGAGVPLKPGQGGGR